MSYRKPIFTLAALLLATALHAALPAALAATTSTTVLTSEVKAELVAHAPQGVQAGQPVWLGLVIQHQPHWHTYWKNPGDSGLPTTLQWQLSGQVVAGGIEWPTPKKLPIGPLMNFGYEGTLLLPVPLTVPAGFGAKTLDVKLHAEWLVCKDVCIPQSGEFALSLPAQASTASHAALFNAAFVATPKVMAGVNAHARVEGHELVVHVAGLPAHLQGKALELLPEISGVLANAGQPASAWAGNVWTTRIALDPQRSEAPKALPGVLVAQGLTTGLLLTIDVTTPWPAAAAPPPPLPSLGDARVTSATATDTPLDIAPQTAPMGLPLALLFALLGGALLNLMPCVFPVLSLKVLGFASQAHDRKALLAGGLAYTTGVVISFVGLAALLLALRAGGEQLGWGFQLQSPVVVALLAGLFTLIGLNLAGVFEVGSVLPGDVASARASHPLMDHALTGVLAVAVAAPCTAPFMGASLGLALTLPLASALSVFVALGLGMALPYLLASAWPALARALPRPGVWMAHFKVLMAFPMFATVVWLVWVLGQQVGIDGAAALLVLLVMLSMAAWAWGSQTLGPRARRGFGWASIALLGLSLFWAAPMLVMGDAAPISENTLENTPEATATLSATPISNVNRSADWHTWSPARVAELRAQGRPVLVDFTAAWCVTCQLNKRTTFANAKVKADFALHKVALLRADWTRRDPVITAELARLGRSGVPVYVLYVPGSNMPRVLPELLSVTKMQEALATLP